MWGGVNKRSFDRIPNLGEHLLHTATKRMPKIKQNEKAHENLSTADRGRHYLLPLNRRSQDDRDPRSFALHASPVKRHANVYIRILETKTGCRKD